MGSSAQYDGWKARFTEWSGTPNPKAVTTTYPAAPFEVDAIPTECLLTDIRVHLDAITDPSASVIVSIWRDNSYAYILAPEQTQALNVEGIGAGVGGVSFRIDRDFEWNTDYSPARVSDTVRVIKTGSVFVAVRLSAGTANIKEIELSGRY